MIMSNQACFPTQGELVQFTFSAFGLLPRKHDRVSEFNEKSKKSFQRLLKRLGHEEGLLLSNFEAALSTFDQLLKSHIDDQNARAVIAGVLRDLYRLYNRMITEDGTFLPKHLSILYFIFSRAMTASIESAQFHSLRQRLFCEYGLIPLESDWFLPDIDSVGEITWPLSKVMRWIYGQAGCSQTQFHFPGKAAASDNPTQQQNLENARNWVRGRTLPSLPALLKNFSQSLEALDKRADVITDLAQSAPLLLTVARVSTAICQDIREVYGAELFGELTDDYRNFIQEIKPEIQEFKSEIAATMQVSDHCELSEETWNAAYAHYVGFFRRKKSEAHETLTKLEEASPNYPFKPPVIEALSQRLGNYPVFSSLYPLSHKGRWAPSPEFHRLLKKGFCLKNDPNTTRAEAKTFRRELRASNLENHLCWLSSWIEAACAYREERFSEAMHHFEKAFIQAKYRAGSYQYKLVNQYLESCAKNNQKGKFKKGLEWANYLGIEIRWLRDNEQTKENIDFAFFVLRNANYVHL